MHLNWYFAYGYFKLISKDVQALYVCATEYICTTYSVCIHASSYNSIFMFTW